MTDILLYILIAVAAYLIGSISTGLMIAKTASNVNLREMGSKNTGASNVLRVMGLKAGAITFFGDFFKAVIACLIGWWLKDLNGAMLAGLFCIIGHNWPIYHQFKGGKGVACSAAVILMTFPWPAGVIAILLCIAVIAISKMISLGSMTMLVAFKIIVAIQTGLSPIPCIWAFVLVALCVYRHRANIGRILSGTENKLGSKKKA
jgi:acyl-phosphate glycerol 3-phosphate acyltransferase